MERFGLQELFGVWDRSECTKQQRGRRSALPPHSKGKDRQRFSLQPGNLLKSRRGGFSGKKRDDYNSAACSFNGFSLIGIQRFERVITAFDIDIRLGCCQETGCRFIRK